MKRSLLVHSVHFTSEFQPVETKEGRIVQALEPVAIIEMVCPKGVGTTITHKEVIPTEDDAKRVKELFVEGELVDMSFGPHVAPLPVVKTST